MWRRREEGPKTCPFTFATAENREGNLLEPFSPAQEASLSRSQPRSPPVLHYSGGVAVPHPSGDEHRKEKRLLQTGGEQHALGAAQEIRIPPPAGVRGLRLGVVSGVLLAPPAAARGGLGVFEVPCRGGNEEVLGSTPPLRKDICMCDGGRLSPAPAQGWRLARLKKMFPPLVRPGGQRGDGVGRAGVPGQPGASPRHWGQAAFELLWTRACVTVPVWQQRQEAGEYLGVWKRSVGDYRCGSWNRLSLLLRPRQLMLGCLGEAAGQYNPHPDTVSSLKS